MTKTQKLIVGLFALLIGVHASSAIQTVSVMDYKGPHGLGDGEFTLKNTGTEAIGIVQVGQTWQTFCLEYELGASTVDINTAESISKRGTGLTNHKTP